MILWKKICSCNFLTKHIVIIIQNGNGLKRHQLLTAWQFFAKQRTISKQKKSRKTKPHKKTAEFKTYKFKSNLMFSKAVESDILILNSQLKKFYQFSGMKWRKVVFQIEKVIPLNSECESSISRPSIAYCSVFVRRLNISLPNNPLVTEERAT